MVVKYNFYCAEHERKLLQSFQEDPNVFFYKDAYLGIVVVINNSSYGIFASISELWLPFHFSNLSLLTKANSWKYYDNFKEVEICSVEDILNSKDVDILNSKDVHNSTKRMSIFNLDQFR